jgi:anti-sigma B factor antagonist
MDSLQTRIESDERSTVVYLRGRLDIESSPHLRDQLLAILRGQSPPATIAVDLAAVDHMDTSGMATLVEALKIARIGAIAMHLEGLQGRLLHLFEATGIRSLFDISGSRNNPSEAEVS